MLFNSLEFLIFFTVVFALYCVFNRQWQNRLLLAASYLFYGWAEPKFVVLMALTTVADYFIGIRIEDAPTPLAAKRWLKASIVLNLGLLGTFKYLGFVSQNLDALCQWIHPGTHCDLLDMLSKTSPFLYGILTTQNAEGVMKLAVPAGISFYTFHEISYVTDIYRKHIKAARRFEDFAVFISFFPQLVAGPIGRASWQMPQFSQPRRMSYDGWAEGLTLFVIGMFRKIVVADPLGALANHVFNDPSRYGRGSLLLGLYCFSFQIYADFAGYSDMARGLARFMGFGLIQNFDHPYFSTNITEFWRRWHISLSSWLRDYLYIPLGGNRHGKFRTYVNLFLTMFLGGLWHGASWNFAVWGTLHGVYLAVHKWMVSWSEKSSLNRAASEHLSAAQDSTSSQPVDPIDKELKSFYVFTGKCFKLVATFHLVALTWIFFASKTFAQSSAFLTGLFGPRTRYMGIARLNKDDLIAAFVGLAIMLLLIDLPQYLKRDQYAILRWPFAARVAGFLVLVLAALLTRGAEHVPFIYFKF